MEDDFKHNITNIIYINPLYHMITPADQIVEYQCLFVYYKYETFNWFNCGDTSDINFISIFSNLDDDKMYEVRAICTEYNFTHSNIHKLVADTFDRLKDSLPANVYIARID